MNKKTRELNRQNGEMDKKVNAENAGILTDMICYIRMADLSPYQQEAVRNDLLEMVLSAQDRGEGIGRVIGGDFKSFCDDVIESLPHRSAAERALENADTLILCAAVLMLIDVAVSPESARLIGGLFSGGPLDFSYVITWGSILKYAALTALAWGIVTAVGRKAFSLPSAKKGGRPKRLAAGGAAGLCAAGIFLASFWLEQFALFTVNVFVMLGIAAVLFLAHRLLAARL